MATTQFERLHARLAPYGQEHLLAFWSELDEPERRELASQIDDIDLPLVERLIRGGDAQRSAAEQALRAQPPKALRLDGSGVALSRQDARRRGEEALRRGQVGMLLVAGGQGTRLGATMPKGMLPIGPVSERTLFQVLIDQLRAVARRSGSAIPLFLMTSPATHEPTIEYFNQNDRFGLPPDDLVVFCQGTMPAVAAQSGRTLLSGPGEVCRSPDGHGGMLAALAKSGGLKQAERRGISLLFYCQVDNPLTPVCDAEVIGCHLLAESELTTLVVEKSGHLERVGNVVEVDGRMRIIEYSDLPDESARRTNADGSLALWAGNTAVHVFDVAFLQRMAERDDVLPFHRAIKKTPHVDDSGRAVDPDEPNALKFERFIFDLMPHALGALAIEVDRAEAFAPVKNASGAAADTPETAQALMIARHRRWLERAGARVEPGVAVEISPFFALDSDELTSKVAPGLVVREPTFFE